jgi:glycosyltransferase involved in cell wall biosynthesis
MSPPLAVTTVIPTHRRPELMRRALLSVLGQTYLGDIEVIVVFDACDLELPDVALPANRSIRAMANERTRGLAGARNTGIQAASHDFVAFLDDDDYWLPDKLAAQMELAALRPGSPLIGTAMVVEGEGRRHERLLPAETLTQAHLLRDRLAGLHSSSFLFRREALVGPIGMVDEDLPGSYGEDYDLLLRTVKVGPISVVNRPLISATWQGQSYFFGKWAQYAEALEYLIAAHPELARDRRGLGRVESQIAFAHAAAGDNELAGVWARQALRHDPIRVRAYLALAIARGVISHDTIVKAARRVGKGI